MTTILLLLQLLLNRILLWAYLIPSVHSFGILPIRFYHPMESRETLKSKYPPSVLPSYNKNRSVLQGILFVNPKSLMALMEQEDHTPRDTLAIDRTNRARHNDSSFHNWYSLSSTPQQYAANTSRHLVDQQQQGKISLTKRFFIPYDPSAVDTFPALLEPKSLFIISRVSTNSNTPTTLKEVVPFHKDRSWDEASTVNSSSSSFIVSTIVPLSSSIRAHDTFQDTNISISCVMISSSLIFGFISFSIRPQIVLSSMLLGGVYGRILGHITVSQYRHMSNKHPLYRFFLDNPLSFLVLELGKTLTVVHSTQLYKKLDSDGIQHLYHRVVEVIVVVQGNTKRVIQQFFRSFHTIQNETWMIHSWMIYFHHGIKYWKRGIHALWKATFLGEARFVDLYAMAHDIHTKVVSNNWELEIIMQHMGRSLIALVFVKALCALNSAAPVFAGSVTILVGFITSIGIQQFPSLTHERVSFVEDDKLEQDIRYDEFLQTQSTLDYPSLFMHDGYSAMIESESIFHDGHYHDMDTLYIIDGGNDSSQSHPYLHIMLFTLIFVLKYCSAFFRKDNKKEEEEDIGEWNDFLEFEGSKPSNDKSQVPLAHSPSLASTAPILTHDITRTHSIFTPGMLDVVKEVDDENEDHDLECKKRIESSDVKEDYSSLGVSMQKNTQALEAFVDHGILHEINHKGTVKVHQKSIKSTSLNTEPTSFIQRRTSRDDSMIMPSLNLSASSPQSMGRTSSDSHPFNTSHDAPQGIANVVKEKDVIENHDDDDDDDDENKEPNDKSSVSMNKYYPTIRARKCIAKEAHDDELSIDSSMCHSTSYVSSSCVHRTMKDYDTDIQGTDSTRALSDSVSVTSYASAPAALISLAPCTLPSKKKKGLLKKLRKFMHRK